VGERYLITGVQLGLLIATNDEEKRKKIVDEIIDKQFITNTENHILFDVGCVEEFYHKFGVERKNE
jgi:hypothetical protein